MKLKLATLAASVALLAGTSAFAANNDVFIDQTGVENQAVAKQEGDNNIYRAVQLGEGNKAGVHRSNTKGDTTPHQLGNGLRLAIRQEGKNNNAGDWDIFQRGADSDLEILQLGEENKVTTVSQGRNNSDRNFARLVQGGKRNVIGNINQHGDDNTMRIRQYGEDNGKDAYDAAGVTPVMGPVTLLGSSNSFAGQIGNRNRMDILQTGNNNGFNIRQGDYGAGNGNADDSTFFLTQSGSYNYTAGLQVESNQYADVRQNGSRNVAIVNQRSTAPTP